MKSTSSFLIFVTNSLNISITFANDYLVKSWDYWNKRIPTSYITNITNKYINKKRLMKKLI